MTYCFQLGHEAITNGNAHEHCVCLESQLPKGQGCQEVVVVPTTQATPMMSEEHDGSDGATDEAEHERGFAGCKPLAPAEATRQAEAAESEAPRIGRIFYGNDTFYIFFRLHQLLYDRYDNYISALTLGLCSVAACVHACLWSASR
jgi:hypothetical protein